MKEVPNNNGTRHIHEDGDQRNAPQSEIREQQKMNNFHPKSGKRVGHGRGTCSHLFLAVSGGQIHTFFANGMEVDINGGGQMRIILKSQP